MNFFNKKPYYRGLIEKARDRGTSYTQTFVRGAREPVLIWKKEVRDMSSIVASSLNSAFKSVKGHLSASNSKNK
ncbi:MAG: hypothetical protein AAB511_04470 [Patescibacteria group bacterium]